MKMEPEVTEEAPYIVDPANIVQQQADLVRRVMAQITEMHLAISLRDAAIAQLREQVATLEGQLLVNSNGHLESVTVANPELD
jgi:hypothetical protein